MCTFFQLGDVCHFGWPERVKPDVGKFFFDLAEGLCIKFKSQLRMMTALQKQLVASIFKCLLDLLPVCRHICYVSFRVSGYAIEIAKLTVGDADIGGVHITVDLPGDLSMRHLFFSQL